MTKQIDTFAKALAESRSARLSDAEAETVARIAADLSVLLTGPEHPGVYWSRISVLASVQYDNSLGGKP